MPPFVPVDLDDCRFVYWRSFCPISFAQRNVFISNHDNVFGEDVASVVWHDRETPRFPRPVAVLP